MKAKDLKNSIRQMAVEGKLVPQDPADEPASVLLERIREEKHKLIAEGKAKFPKGGESIIYIASDGSPYEKRVDAKGRVLSDKRITDEVPFEELPEGWAWARLGSAFHMQAGKNIKASLLFDEQTEKAPYPCFGGNGIRGFVAKSNTRGDYPIIGRQGALCGNVKRATGEFYATEHAVVVTCFSNTDVAWVCCFLTALNLNQYATATAQPGLAVSKISGVLIPVPPIAEQRRIVERINELMPLVEEYGSLEDAREALDAALPARLRKSVLQMAVQGKLVPQDPADEPASALLGRIREHRRQLIAEKKTKAPKGGESVIFRGSDGRRYEKRMDVKGRESEPVCIEDEIPFEIPESWEWTRLDSICDLVRGSGIKRSDIVDEGLPCVRYGELYTTYETSIDTVASHTSEAVFNVSKKLGAGEVLITLTGENNIDIGRAVFNATGETLAFGGDLLALKGQNVRGDYLAMAINSSVVGSQRTQASTGNIIVHLSATKACRFLIPVPPLDEQRRIVERINEFVTLITNQ